MFSQLAFLVQRVLRSSILLFTVLLIPAAFAHAQDRRGPFTHEPRSVRSRDIDQKHLKLELNVDLQKQELLGRAIHRFVPFKPLRSVTLDAAEMTIRKVAILGAAPQPGERPMKFEVKGHSLQVALDREYSPAETVELAVTYEVKKPRYGAHFVAPDPSEPNQPRMVWTQSEPEFARYWYPCVDSSADRFTSETLVTAAKGLYVLSNGQLKQKTANNNGTETWHWSQEKSHVSYLMSVVVGDFEAMEQNWDGIPILSFVPKGRLADAPRSFEKTAAMMKFFSERIGYRYPWPKYAQICVDEYQWGGMEHTSATTLNLRTLHDERAHLDVSSDNLVAHELVHQWWGDLLTCKDWGEIWLNEGFATYFATLWTEHDEGWDEATWARRQEANGYLDEDKRMRRPIVSYRYNDPVNVFDRHAYPKAGRVLHMLRFELGDDWFWRTLQRYVSVNQHRSVETADLRIAIEEATGQGMNWFFDQWLYHGGHPEFVVDWNWDEATKTARVTVKQTQKVDEMTPLFRTSVELEFASPQSTVIRRVQLSKAEETFHFHLEQRPSRVCFDPRDWILKTLKFDKSKEEWLDQLANDQHLICRVQAAEGLAKYSGSDDVREALLRSLRSDTAWPVRQAAIKALAGQNGVAIRQGLIEAAKGDAKSFVRRDAIAAFSGFAHEDTRQTLRHIIANDRSYYAVAEAMKVLLKIDRANCEAELLKGLDVVSHSEVIENAACNGLVELKSAKAVEKLASLLKTSLSPERRAVFVSALARLKPDQKEYLDLLREQLSNDRNHVRRVAIDAVATLNPPGGKEWLLERRAKEEMGSMLQTIDDALAKLRGKEQDLESLRKEVEDLRKQNRSLEERLKKLEAMGK